MASFPDCFIFLTILIILLHHITRTTQLSTCETTHCGDSSLEPPIQYPFYIQGVQSEDCGFPNFGVSCNNLNQTLIKLGDAGIFAVKEISLTSHQIRLNDPNKCLPLRFLNGDLDQNLQSSPFRWSSDYFGSVNVDFYNCTVPLPVDSLRLAHKIDCLSSGRDNITVVAILSDLSFPTTSMSLPKECQHISSSAFPIDSFAQVQDQLWIPLYTDIRFTWNECMYPDDREDNIACFNNLPEPPSYTIYKILVVAAAGTLCFCVAGLARLLGFKVEDGVRRRRLSGESERNTETVEMEMGLSESTIEQYPKTQVGHGGKLLDDNTVCPICLSEYEPMDTLRTIPHCNHYFHVHCIDGWLKKKGTCPLCRHLPHASISLSLSASDSHRLLIPN